MFGLFLIPLVLGLLVAVFVPNIVGKTSAENIETLNAKISTALNPGSTKDEIEMFLSSTSWRYGYDKYSQRYIASPAEEQSECIGRNLLIWLFYECGIQILINVNQSGSYKGHTVEQVYSGL